MKVQKFGFHCFHLLNYIADENFICFFKEGVVCALIFKYGYKVTMDEVQTEQHIHMLQKSLNL